MKKEPKVAVYMSCYNHEAYVAEAVDSILNQTYKNLELYVVNDGSTDRTGYILEQYQDERMKYFDFEENTKFVGAANFLQDVIEVSDADYVASMASDDKWELDKLEKQIAFMQEHPEYPACFTWDKLIFSADRTEYKDNLDYSHHPNRNRYDWISFFLNNGNVINANSMLMKKDVFYEIGKVNEYYLQVGDYRAWIRLAERYPFYIMPEELTFYRRHDTNLSNTSISAVARGCVETYRIFRETYIPMEKDTFRRSFYADTVYFECDTEEELWAEKFFVLLSCQASGYRSVAYQTAIDMYFDHCENKKFISVLEDKYYFFAKDFIQLTGDKNIAYSLNDFSLNTILKLPQTENFLRAEILLRSIDERKFDIYSFTKYTYGVLYDLYEMTSRYEGGLTQFVKIKESVDKLREKRLGQNSRNVLLVIGEEKWSADCHIETFLYEIQQREKAVSVSYSIAFIPQYEAGFAEKNDSCEKQIEFPANVRQINLYNEKEHCLYFLWEISEVSDAIYYLNCIDDRYECNRMMAGYSLGVSHNAILQKDMYNNIQQNHPETLLMLKNIIVY